ncbi:MAG TPA: hypothetical protein VKH19_00450 [Gemmatimonadaceae bacterium]|nr:hypothetical protein [Gemmatimonadaceae bacterium]
MTIHWPKLRLHVLVAVAALVACGYDSTYAPPPPPPPPPAPVLLKDVVIPNLPSPYYHFEYDTDGRVRTVSFASDLRIYDVIYDGGRISEMRNNAVGNKDRLVYHYDDAGRVSFVAYVSAESQLEAVVFLGYTGTRLTTLERDRSLSSGFLVEKVMSFAYDAAGNVSEITERIRAGDGQPQTTTVERYEDYDGKVNVDGFSLVHDEFFDHLVLLPGVVFQHSNARAVTHTGDGINFSVAYAYSYDAQNRPLMKNGDVLILNGADAGKRVAIQSAFTYY